MKLLLLKEHWLSKYKQEVQTAEFKYDQVKNISWIEKILQKKLDIYSSEGLDIFKNCIDWIAQGQVIKYLLTIASIITLTFVSMIYLTMNLNIHKIVQEPSKCSMVSTLQHCWPWTVTSKIMVRTFSFVNSFCSTVCRRIAVHLITSQSI